MTRGTMTQHLKGAYSNYDEPLLLRVTFTFCRGLAQDPGACADTEISFPSCFSVLTIAWVRHFFFNFEFLLGLGAASSRLRLPGASLPTSLSSLLLIFILISIVLRIFFWRTEAMRMQAKSNTTTDASQGNLKAQPIYTCATCNQNKTPSAQRIALGNTHTHARTQTHIHTCTHTHTHTYIAMQQSSSSLCAVAAVSEAVLSCAPPAAAAATGAERLTW